MPRTVVERGLSLLGGAPGDVALISSDAVVTYAELHQRVDERVQQLGPVRRLVMAIAANDLEPLVTLESKRGLWKRALEERWLLVFEHDPVTPWGRLDPDADRPKLTESS